MANINISIAARNAAADVICGLLNAGGGPGKLRIYSGTQPATPNTAPTPGEILLAEIILNTPAFAPAVGGVAMGNVPIVPVICLANGVATWFRTFDTADNPGWDGVVAMAAAPLIVTTTSFIAGLSVAINSLSYTMPMTCL